MSFKATLFIFEKEYRLLDLDYNLKQVTDDTGRPKSRVMGGKIHLSFESTGQDEGFYEAMFSSTMMVKGHIRVYKRDGFQKSFDLKFANAFITGLTTSFNHVSTENLKMDAVISAQIMEIRGQLYESPTNPNNPFIEAAPVTVREEKEPEIVSATFKDSNGNEVQKVTKGTVTLHVETKDMVGEMISIDLSDNNYDFLYNGELIENDLLEDISVRSDQMSIELEVIKQKIS